MNFSKSAVALLAIAALTLSSVAFAGERGKTINERQQNQNERIKQGVKSGELTRREATRLRHHQMTERRYERHARRTGDGISQKEAQRIGKMQDKQSKAIYNQKHDTQERH